MVKMNCYSKNKNELLTLTGAVYSFVAYLTAFTLEILFMIDLAKRTNNLVALAAGNTNSTPTSNYDENPSHVLNTFEQARLALESMQTHLTISCLAIAILYFVLFVASLILIIALILRSTFFILIWVCIMTTMYLPEFGLIIYNSIYGWGLDTRNGQTELLFYLFRAALNIIFIFRAHKLFKEWNYEKNFFMLKSGSRFSGYDSPYLIGDSLTTTINPVFSSSTLHLDRYDHVRDMNSSPADNSFFTNQNHYQQNQVNSGGARKVSSLYSHDTTTDSRFRPSYGLDTGAIRKGFFLGNEQPVLTSPQSKMDRMHLRRNNSVLSINDNDDYADFEMDLDYRTLTNQRHYQQNNEPSPRQPVARFNSNDAANGRQPIISVVSNVNRSPSSVSYSTQSLDRRQFRDTDFGVPEQVILRPLGHQPFDYLRRPGSSTNLNSINDVNTQPTAYANNNNNKKPVKRNGSNLTDRFA